MAEVISMAKLGAEGGPPWSWCIPAGGSKVDVVILLFMTSEGMRYVPSRIPAPETYRHLKTDYVELTPWPSEIKLANNSWAWRLSSFPALPSLAQQKEILDSLHDMLAVARFFPDSEIPCEPADRPLPETDTYFGRSVLVRPNGSRVHVTAWIASAQNPFDLVCLNLDGRPRRFVAEWNCLIEDGTLPPSHAGGCIS